MIVYGIIRLAILTHSNDSRWSIQIFWLYALFILLIPGLVQMNDGSYYWDTLLGYPAEQELLASLILACGIIITDISYILFSRNAKHSICSNSLRINEDKYLKILKIFTLIGVAWSSYLFARFGFSFFLRSRGAVASDFGDTFSLAELGLIIGLNSALLTALFISCFQQVIRKDLQKNSWYKFLLIVNASQYLIINYPGRVARFALLGTLLSLVFIYIKNSKSKIDIGFWLTVSFPLSLYYVFRFLGGYNRSGIFDFDAAWSSAKNLKDNLSSGDFDGFQMTILGVRYVISEGYTWGNQILSALLFFVPRSIWENKALPTGALLGTNEGFSYTNLSSPIYIEGYLDLGFIGVAILAYILGYLIFASDRALHKNEANITILPAIVFTAFLPIILRGSLLAVCSGILTIIFILFIMKRYSLEQKG